MSSFVDPEFWARLLSIVVIDLTLAGDNALVIALAVRTLPRRQQFLGRVWGTVGAVGLRLAFIVVATWLLRIPFLQLAGGLLLIWIAIKLVRQSAGEGDEHVRHGGSLREAIWIIIMADAAMSLDNVLAVAAAAHGDLLLVAFGIGLSLPIVVWGSGLLAWLMNRFAWIIWVGGGILGYVAGEMVLRDQGLEPWLGAAGDWLRAVPVALGLAIAGLGWWHNGAPWARTSVATSIVSNNGDPTSSRSSRDRSIPPTRSPRSS
ncbi:MAG TPA: TerC family protein [Methylomirabilota bacterium]|jgi:YjbE family integral membrane protein|nr:TerC family protein [Methylomirabilota bacterium]